MNPAQLFRYHRWLLTVEQHRTFWQESLAFLEVRRMIEEAR